MLSLFLSLSVYLTRYTLRKIVKDCATRVIVANSLLLLLTPHAGYLWTNLIKSNGFTLVVL